MTLSFRDFSIKAKLTTLIMVASGAALVVASSAIVINESVRFRRSMVDGLSTVADVVGLNTAAALAFRDTQAAEENMATLRAEPAVIGATIFTLDGQPFAVYRRDDLGHLSPHSSRCTEVDWFIGSGLAPGARGVREHQFCGNHVDLIRPIVVNNETVGMVYVQGDLGALAHMLWRYLGIVGVVMAGSFAIAFLLSSYLQRIVSKPILNLASTMRKVSQEGDYAVRAARAGDDEVGNLIDGFNQMLEQIKNRDDELEQYRDHLEDEVKRRTVELAEARDQALAASKAKSAFVANMSHEIRTPLHAVLGYAQLLKQAHNLTRDQVASLAAIEASGDHLLALINSILDLSKIEAGALELKVDDFELFTLLRELSSMFRARCAAKNLAWKLEGLDGQPAAVRGDAHKLNQVLINLVGNAVKFTRSGGVTLAVSRLGADRFRFAVIDTGPGISPEDQERLSEPFHQGQEGAQKGGFGLGMAIANRLTELMDGALQLESELGKGSRFFFELVLPPAESEIVAPADEPRGLPRLSAGTPVAALVVDDVKANVDVLARMLRQLGAEAGEAEHGKQALQRLRARRFDIVFMDIRMPVMDGLEALEAIQAEFEPGSIKCVAVTASSLVEQKKDFLKAGFVAHIAKPFRFEEICDCLSKHLGVSYEYEEAEPGLAGDATAEQDFSQIRLPAGLPSMLKKAAELYQVSDLDDLLVKVEALGPAELCLAEHLRVFLRDFDMAGILHALTQVGDDR